MVLSKFGQGGPLLSIEADVLPFIQTDRAARRRSSSAGILRATGYAYVGTADVIVLCHITSSLRADRETSTESPNSCVRYSCASSSALRWSNTSSSKNARS